MCDVLSTYKFQAPVTSGIFIHPAFTRFYIVVLDCEMHFFFFFIFSEKKNCSNTDTWYSSKVTSLSLFVDMCHPLNVNIIFFCDKNYKTLHYDIGCHMSYINTETACLLHNEIRPSLVIICLQFKFNNTTSINPPTHFSFRGLIVTLYISWIQNDSE